MKKTTKKWGMIALTVLMLTSSFTAFMTSYPTKSEVKLFIKFDEYEGYRLDIPVNENSTLLDAISTQFPVKTGNGTCIRDVCNGKGKWLFFDEKGYPVTINTTISSGTYYAIYNLTSSSAEKDSEAIMKLLNS